MTDCDMILMQAYSTISRSVVSDLWSTDQRTPSFDSSEDMTNVTIVAGSNPGMQRFEFSRKLDTGDIE